MNLTARDVKHAELLKSTSSGDIISVETLGGLYVLYLKKKSGEVELLSSSTSSLRSQAIASKRFPHLEVPVIVKSEKDFLIVKDAKTSPKVQAGNNISAAKHSLLTAKQKIGKLIGKPKTMKLDAEEQTRKVDTIVTQKAVRRNNVKVQKQKPAAAKHQYTPPPSEEVTHKLPIKTKKGD